MKKAVLLLLVAIILCFLCSCAKKPNPDTTGTSSYVNIDDFEDTSDTIKPSTPQVGVDVPSEWMGE